MTRRLQLATPFKDTNENEYPFVDVRLWKLGNYNSNEFVTGYSSQLGSLVTSWDVAFILYFYRIDGNKILLVDEENSPIFRLLFLPRTINFGSSTTVGKNIYLLFYTLRLNIGNPPDFTDVIYSPFGESWLHTDAAGIPNPPFPVDGYYYATTGLRDLLILQGGPDFAELTVVEV